MVFNFEAYQKSQIYKYSSIRLIHLRVCELWYNSNNSLPNNLNIPKLPKITSEYNKKISVSHKKIPKSIYFKSAITIHYLIQSILYTAQNASGKETSIQSSK